ncbi:hypothetical protein ACIQ34_07270 [Ureibacillus sp. NPDC094379]
MEIKSKLVKRAKKSDSESFQMLIREEKLYRIAIMYMQIEDDAT